jgi:type II secretory pathway component PulF
MLKKGCQLKEALSLLQQLEKGTIAEGEIALWQKHISEGRGKLSQFASPGLAFTPLFLWLASNAGEDLATGFQRAGEVYYERALRRAEILLYSVLPVCTLLLGAMIVAQLLPLLHHVRQMFDVLGSFN